MGVRHLTDAPLHVEAHLLETPLASPTRRMAAFAIDAALLVVPTVAASLLVAALAVYVRDRAAFDAGWNLLTGKAATSDARTHAVAALLPLLVATEPEGLPHEVETLVEEGHTADAMRILADYDFSATLSFSHGGGHDPLPPKTIRVQLEKLIPGAARGMALFFVPALYFVLFTCGRRGATLGKRLAGIRVVRLDGHHLSWLEGLERFIGYLHIPGTFFIGLYDLWHDPNRRMAHDRVAHTAVVRVTPSSARPTADAEGPEPSVREKGQPPKEAAPEPPAV